MSVLIKGMEMPDKCCGCPMGIFQDAFSMPYCSLTGEDISDREFRKNRLPNCPLVEVKTPHGRLIDAGFYFNEMRDRQYKCVEWRAEAKANGDDEIYYRAEGALSAFIEAKLTLEKVPTIIEAEE